MKVKVISYGHKFYEGESKAPPYHDFLFSLRDLVNPFWVPELKEFNGLDSQVIEFFEKDEGTQTRLKKVDELIRDFIKDFCGNKHRTPECSLTFAFKCTGGKHRSVYFAQSIFKKLSEELDDSVQVELEHVDLPKYLGSKC